MANDAPEGTVGHYRARLKTMHDRLARLIADEKELAEESLKGSTGDGILHTHNADMDTEGLDAAVSTARGLHDELDQVDGALTELSDRDPGETLDGDEKARFDLLLSTQDFAETMDKKFGTKGDS